MRYTNTPLPKKYTNHRLEAHPEIRYAIKGIVNGLGNPEHLTEENFSENAFYLYGIDLFNEGYYWECHELLETLWKLGEKRTAQWFFLKGVIQLSISVLKHERGEPKGRDLLFEGGSGYLRDLASDIYGINREDLILQVYNYEYGTTLSKPKITLASMSH